MKKSELDGQRKSSTRKKAVTVDIDGGKPKDEKHRRRNSSKILVNLISFSPIYANNYRKYRK